MSSPDTLLVVGAGPLQCYTIREARALGLQVIATDQSVQAPGARMADLFYTCDVYNIDAHRHLARDLRNDGVSLIGVTGAGGDTAPTVAACAEEMGAPGIPYDVAAQTWNKWSVRDVLDKAGLGEYQPAWTERTLRYLMHGIQQIGYPCIVKPCHSRASRGITIVRTLHDVSVARNRLTAYASNNDFVLIESFLTGSEHSAEILFDNEGNCVHFHVCDRFFDYSTGIPLELCHINPSRLTDIQQAAVKMMLYRTADALGITRGPWKCDVLWTDAGPKILEGAARCSGGYDAQVSYPRATGDNYLRQVIQVTCRMPVAPQRLATPGHYCAVAGILPQKTGTVHALPDCHGSAVLWSITPGAHVQPPAHNAERAGFVVVEGDDYEEVRVLALVQAQQYAQALAEGTA